MKLLGCKLYLTNLLEWYGGTLALHDLAVLAIHVMVECPYYQN